MASGTTSIGINIGGVSRSKSITRTGAVFADDVTPGAGKEGDLTTRTSGLSGVITTDAAHGITDAARIDVGWTDSYSLNRHRCNMTVSSYTSDTLTVTGGNGDAFPAQDTAVVVGARTAVDFSADGTYMRTISIHSEPPSGQTSSRAIVDFVDSSNNTFFPFDANDNEPFVWHSNSPMPNKLHGYAIEGLEVSSLSSQAPTVSIELQYEAG